jgi:uncharacterized protein (TIGR03067 family)
MFIYRYLPSRLLGLMVMPVVLSCSILVAQEPDTARAKLVGTWIGYAVKGKGERPEQMGVKVELKITKDTIQGFGFKGKDKPDLGTGTFTLKLDATPHHLDGDKKIDNPKRKEVWLGIYELDGDNLRWCVGRKKRPTEFDGKDDAFLLILKRQKAPE